MPCKLPHLLLFVAGCAAFTVASAKDDLLTVYKLAAVEDRALRAAAADLQAQREAIPQARSELLPTAGLGADLAANHVDPERVSSDDFSSYGLGLTLTQPVYARASYLRQGQAASFVDQAEASYAATEQELILRTVSAYFDILSTAATLNAVRADKEAIARQLEQTKQRFEVGLIAITDVHEAQARYDNVVFQEIVAVNDVENAREALRVITGSYHGDIAGLVKELPLVHPEPSDIDSWVATAERDNLSLVSARYGVEVAREEIEIQRSGNYPSVDLVAGYARSDTDGGGSGRLDSGSVALELNVPLYTGGLIASQTREAEQRLVQAAELLDQALREVQQQARDAYRNVDATIRGVEALRQAVVSNQSALDATQAGFEVGTRTVVDVLDAQRDLFQAQRDYELARNAYVVSTLRLKQAVGSLAPQDIEALNSQLE